MLVHHQIQQLVPPQPGLFLLSATHACAHSLELVYFPAGVKLFHVICIFMIMCLWLPSIFCLGFSFPLLRRQHLSGQLCGSMVLLCSPNPPVVPVLWQWACSYLALQLGVSSHTRGTRSVILISLLTCTQQALGRFCETSAPSCNSSKERLVLPVLGPVFSPTQSSLGTGPLPACTVSCSPTRSQAPWASGPPAALELGWGGLRQGNLLGALSSRWLWTWGFLTSVLPPAVFTSPGCWLSGSWLHHHPTPASLAPALCMFSPAGPRKLVSFREERRWWTSWLCNGPCELRSDSLIWNNSAVWLKCLPCADCSRHLPIVMPFILVMAP